MSDELKTALARAKPPGLSVGDVCRYWGRSGRSRHDVAIATATGEVTWAALDRRSTQIAAGLRQAGLRRGDHIAVLMTNCVEFVELVFGVAKAGCAIVPLNARSVGREIAYCLEKSDARAMVTQRDLLPVVIDAAAHLDVGLPDELIFIRGGDGQRHRSFDELLGLDTEDAISTPPVDPDSDFWIAFTSGTTGAPKAARVTHRRIIDTWSAFLREFELARRDRILLAAPLYGGIGFNFALACLFGGGQLIIQNAFVAADVLTAIEACRVTMTPLVPTMYDMLLEHPSVTERDLSSVRIVLSLGAPLLSDTKKRLLGTFTGGGIYEFYGSTELGATALIHPVDQLRKQRSVGQAVMGVDIRLLDDSGNDVPIGEIGEIYKRGLMLGSEYYGNDAATSAAHRGDWATSGDLGRFDDEGYLYVVDRKKDMIITGGFNVYPSEVEDVIADLKGVRQVAVVGLPDARWGEAVVAAVVLDDSVTAEDVRAHCVSQLADFKRPKRVAVLSSLPVNAAGKVAKPTLRDLLG